MARWRLYDYSASANCYKVRLALAQIGAAYERVAVDIFAGDTLTDAYGEVNPARETPVLEVDASARLPESGAILAYVAQGTPLLPDDRWIEAQVLRWLLFEQTGVMWTIGRLPLRLLTGRWAADTPEAIARHAAAVQALHLRPQPVLARTPRDSMVPLVDVTTCHPPGEESPPRAVTGARPAIPRST